VIRALLADLTTWRLLTGVGIGIPKSQTLFRFNASSARVTLLCGDGPANESSNFGDFHPLRATAVGRDRKAALSIFAFLQSEAETIALIDKKDFGGVSIAIKSGEGGFPTLLEPGGLCPRLHDDPFRPAAFACCRHKTGTPRREPYFDRLWHRLKDFCGRQANRYRGWNGNWRTPLMRLHCRK
jgi:hypothetical protein